MAVKLEKADFLQIAHNAGKRGIVTQFSDASRRRRIDLLAKMDYSQVLLWLDLTYPDHFPDSCEVWKGHLEAFFKLLKSRFRNASAIWKLEFLTCKSGENKGKIAPHFHLLLWACLGNLNSGKKKENSIGGSRTVPRLSCGGRMFLRTANLFPTNWP